MIDIRTGLRSDELNIYNNPSKMTNNQHNFIDPTNDIYTHIPTANCSHMVKLTRKLDFTLDNIYHRYEEVVKLESRTLDVHQESFPFNFDVRLCHVI